MTILDCPKCGGIHYGSHECPYTSAPCVVCGEQTVMACSDCAIDSGGKVSVHVCARSECRDTHEREKHSSKEDGLMDFGEAVEVLKNGGRVRRLGWNGTDMWIKLQSPDAQSLMTLPYIYMRTVAMELVPWVASHTDILADDWELVV